jgi:hypothetical protein
VAGDLRWGFGSCAFLGNRAFSNTEVCAKDIQNKTFIMVFNSIQPPFICSYDNSGALSSHTNFCVMELFLEVIYFRGNFSTSKWLLYLVCGPF